MVKNVYLSKILSIFLIFLIVSVIFCIQPSSVQAGTTYYNQTLKSGIDAFPESYQVLLRQFVEETAHTNWNFQAFYTGIDWDDFISAESVHGRNRVHSSLDTIYRDSCNDLAIGYYCADRAIISYFVDPRNFINERNIFQFLEISYNKDLYTKELIENMIKNYPVFNNGNEITFVMSYEEDERYGQEVTMTYADIIMAAAEKSQMSPISIVTKILQEVGSAGSSSTNGKSESYPNCYNFFNIGAYDTGDAILNALSYADKQGWHCPYSSIVEGAEYNTRYYVQAGQNTPYFYKYDCVGSRILSNGEEITISSNELYHQYMTNISDPYSQSATYFSTYTNYQLLDKTLNFIIPVYNNMPLSVEKPSTLLAAENQDLYYAHISSSLITRTGPDYDYPKTSIVLYKDDLVIMLERNVTNTDKWNESWDRVQFWNGSIGYVKSEYLDKYDPNNENGRDETTQIKSEHKIIGYGYADVSSTLNIRQGPGSTYKITATLAPQEEFGILDETDGWYKILTSDNIIGYVSKEFAKQMGYAKIENNSIMTIPEANSDTIAKILNLTDYTVKNGDSVITDGTIGTGYKFISGDKEYTIVKKGDLNGDGNADIIDMALIKRYLLQKMILDGEYKEAGKLKQDSGDIDIIDMALMKRYLLGTEVIKI